LQTKKRLEITIDTERVFVIRRGSRSATAWCGACGQRVTMITPDEAAITAHVSTRAVYRLVEAGRLHFLEVPDGLLLVCLNSLSSASLDDY
jgi:hypothetical protein